MRGATFPTFAKVTDKELSVAAHSRGGTIAGGALVFERGPGARWVGSLSIAPLCANDALAFRAFLHSIRGKSGSFAFEVQPALDVGDIEVPDLTQYSDATTFSDATVFSDYVTPPTQFADDTTFSDTTTFSDPTPAVFIAPGVGVVAGDHPADTETLTFATFGGITPKVGDFAYVGETGAGQLVRVVSISGSAVGIRPRLRSAVTGGTAVFLNGVTADFRFAGDVPVVPIVPGGRSSAFSFEFEELY